MVRDAAGTDDLVQLQRPGIDDQPAAGELSVNFWVCRGDARGLPRASRIRLRHNAGLDDPGGQVNELPIVGDTQAMALEIFIKAQVVVAGGHDLVGVGIDDRQPRGLHGGHKPTIARPLRGDEDQGVLGRVPGWLATGVEGSQQGDSLAHGEFCVPVTGFCRRRDRLELGCLNDDFSPGPWLLGLPGADEVGSHHQYDGNKHADDGQNNGSVFSSHSLTSFTVIL